MKVGDKVIMKKDVCPNSNFRTGVVMEVIYDGIRVKRDNYKGHEYTWWNKEDWKVNSFRWYNRP